MSDSVLNFSSKSGFVAEKKDFVDYNKLIYKILRGNLKQKVRGKNATNADKENKKKEREIMPSTKSAKMFPPRQENK